MRQVLHGDIIAAARCLVEIPPSDRAAAISDMLYHAHTADKVTKRTGAPHKTWGNGSLMAAALPRPKHAEPSLSNLDYLAALHIILDALMAWRQSRRASIQRHPA